MKEVAVANNVLGLSLSLLIGVGLIWNSNTGLLCIAGIACAILIVNFMAGALKNLF